MTFSLGIPKELKPREQRVGLVPGAVEFLVQQGTRVYVEQDAGIGSGFSNSLYERAGAILLDSREDLYGVSDLVVKVKEPIPAEYGLLRPQQMVFCFFHLASPAQADLLKTIEKSKITAIGFETLVDQGRLPLLAPMSHIAGGLGASYAALLREMNLVENGKISYPPDFQKKMEDRGRFYPKPMHHSEMGEVVIFGGGVAGRAALDMIGKMRGKAVMIEKNETSRLKFSHAGIEAYAPESIPAGILENADVLIGAAHAVGQRAVRVLTPDQMQRMSRVKKKIIIDIAIDQGGNYPESRPTTYDDPVFLDSWGNIRFCVANIPSLAGHAASTLLSEALLPYLRILAADPIKALAPGTVLNQAIYIRNGEILFPGLKTLGTST